MESIKLHLLSLTPLSPSERDGYKAINSGILPDLIADKNIKVFGKGLGKTPFTKGVFPKGCIQ